MRAYLQHEHPLRLAHRGSRLLWPENTMLAFQGAVDLGYRYLESDLHMTADGVLVLFHDDELDRLTNGAGPVSAWTWEELRLLDAAYYFDPERGFPERSRGHGIPTLAEAMRSFPEALFNLDLKQPGIEDAVAGFSATHGAEDRMLIASFHGARIQRFRTASGGRVATSAGPAEVSRVWAAARLGRPARVVADALQVPTRSSRGPVDARFVRTAHEAGAHVHVWTINDRDEMARLLDLGVDGIVTDRPDTLNELLDEIRPPR